MHFCQHCGTQNGDTAKYCRDCGQALAARAAQHGPQGTLLIHTLLRNRYQVMKLLGQGGMGAVYLAQDRNAFNRACVIKEMLAYYQTPAEQRKAEQDFEREARFLADLRHDSVPQMYEYFIEQGRYYLVMEYVAGETLEERLSLANRPFTEQEAGAYTLQLANALVYLTAQTPPVIHRDIKPANIILDEAQGRVKLVDFGLAKENSATDKTTGHSVPLGTPGYAPPEQYSGHVEPRTDVYGLGATVHHLLTGRDPREEKPFDFPPARDVVPTISPALSALVSQMLEPKLDSRPHATEVVDRLQALIHTGPLASTASSNGSQPLTTQPFAIRSGPLADDATALALVCDDHWDDGLYHLYEGHFEPWLENQNRKDLAARAKSIRLQQGNRSAGLEEFLQAANPTLPLPSLAVDSMSIDLGKVKRGMAVEEQVWIKNRGRGCLSGEIVPADESITVQPETFHLMKGKEAEVNIRINTQEFAEGIRRQPLFVITSNGGQESVTANVQVIWPPELNVEPDSVLNFDSTGTALNPLVTKPLVIQNQGGGILRGRVWSDAPWLTLSRSYFQLSSGQSTTVQVSARFQNQSVPQQDGSLHITAPEIEHSIVAHVRQPKPDYNTSSQLMTWLPYAPLLALIYTGLSVPPAILVTAGLTNLTLGGLQFALIFVIIAVAAGAFYGARRLTPRLDEMEEYYYADDLVKSMPRSYFSARKIYDYVLYSGLFGALIGWQAAAQIEGGILLGTIAGIGAGAALGATGTNSPVLPTSPQWLARLWHGSTLYSSLTIGIIRTLALVSFCVMLSVLLAGSDQAPNWSNMVISALIGLFLSTENHHWVTTRICWLLAFIRQALAVGLGSFMTLTTLSLLIDGTAWPIISTYGRLQLESPSLGSVLQPIALIVAGISGALGAYWLTQPNGTKQKVRWPDVRRVFPAMTALLSLSGLPIYLLFGLIFSVMGTPMFTNWITLIATLGTILTAAWLLRDHRSQMERILQHAQSGMGRSSGKLQKRARIKIPKKLTKLWKKISGIWKIPKQFKKLRLPSLTELERHATRSFVLCASAAALLLVPIIAKLIIGIIAGTGLLLYYLLWIAIGLWGLLFVARRIRT